MRRAVALSLCLFACGGSPAPGPQPAPVVEPEAPPPDTIELVESWPIETTLDHADIPDAHEVWVEMIDGAEQSLDFLEFYGTTTEDGRLEPVIAAVERAAARGVRVRFAFDARMLDRNPDVPPRLDAIGGVEVRIYDFSTRGGGVQHTKLFVVDDREAFVGSQNFDWRSLTHIQELGLRVREPALVRAVAALFALDWALAEGETSLEDARPAPTEMQWPVRARFGGEEVEVTPGFSPNGWLPDEALWEWPQMRAAIEGARERVRLQVMSYHLHLYGGGEWTELDEALRAAAARGVTVELMVSHWETRPDRIADLQALQRVENVEVRIVTIPQASSGFIPFARTIHAKYLTVDGARGWVGTSNASGDYFTRSRNAGFFVEGAVFARRLDAFFDDLWTSDYAEAVDPERTYEAPRVSE